MRQQTAIKAGLTDSARAAWQSMLNRAAGLLVEQPPRVDEAGLNKYREYFNERMDELGVQLADGKLTVNQWQRAMGEEIEKLHMTGWALGRGGVANMGKNDLREVRRKIGEQKQYLERWAGDLRKQRNSSQEFVPTTVANRGKLYGGAASATVNQANTASIGLPRLPQYPGDGKGTRCKTNCMCSIRVSKLKGDGNWNVYWKLGSSGIKCCPDCEDLARKWDPLKIRKGIILN